MWPFSTPIRCPELGSTSLLAAMGVDHVKGAGRLEELEDLAKGAPPFEIMLINLSRDAISIDQIMERIRVNMPDCRVVFLGVGVDMDLMSECFGAGARGYLSENVSSDTLRESLRLVSAGGMAFPSELAGLIIKRFDEAAAAVPDAIEALGVPLSIREIDILRCLARGGSNKVIAERLNIAEATVKVHIRSILRKTGAANRTQAALWAAGKGLGAMLAAILN